MLNENVLHGAWRAVGLSSSPRPDGSGITFVCPRCKEPTRLSVSDGVSCPSCSWSANGEPWEIAKAAHEVKGGKTEAKDGDEAKKSLGEKMRAAIYHPSRRRPKSVPVYGIGGTPVCFAGDITVIEAQVKSGKTAFVGAAISSVFSDPGADCLGWMSKNPEGKAVVHFDTEQSGDDHDSLCERIQARAQKDEYPGWLQSYCVTGFSLVELREAVAMALELAKKVFGGVHSLILDGIADFVGDVNDPEAANAVISWLMATAIEWQMPIIVVLHLNPITSKTQIAKARGHLGSQLYRKAAHVLRIEKDGDGVSSVVSVHARKAQVPKDAQPVFMWSDEKKRHVSCKGEGFGEQERRRSDLMAVAMDCFEGVIAGSGLAYNELLAGVMKSIGCSRTTAQNTVSEMRSLQVVTQGKGRLYHLAQ